MTARTLTEWRAVDAPFALLGDWDPIPGTCSRCGSAAWLGETRWWHTLEPCASRGRSALFIPAAPHHDPDSGGGGHATFPR